MKVSKQMNVYCPKCKKHSPHGVSIYKKGKERALAKGTRKHERKKHGYGGQKWPELVRKIKTTKKQLLKLKCKECGCIVSRLGNRISKLQVE